jgi:ATP-dependent Clp protease ATP-binding subunit ClpC
MAFSDLAVKSVEFAQNEAFRLRCVYTGTEHLLLGIIRLNEGVAIEMLRNLSIDPVEVKSTIEQIIIPSANPYEKRQMPLTWRAYQALLASEIEARKFRSIQIEPEHILISLVHNGKGIAARLLSSWDFEYIDAVTEFRRMIEARISRPGLEA